MQGQQLMLVVDRSALSHLAGETQTVIGGLQTTWELWSPASPAQLKAALASARAGSDVGLARTAHAERSTLTFESLSWSFAFLEALGILAGVMALVGLLLYLQARQQSREVAYALGRRMGMTSAAHRRSVISELGGMLGSAFVAGSLFAWVASLMVQGRLDPLPSLPPSPALRVPGAPIGLTAAALAAAVVVGAAAVQRRADRASVAEVMRRAE
jgi:putative ABC transport system permease protein